jgi:hypothetical protein
LLLSNGTKWALLKRIETNGDYLIIAPNMEKGIGYHHTLTERAYLVDNLINFLKQHPDIKEHQITVYELREVNENRPDLPPAR